MNGERRFLERVRDFDPLPVAYTAGIAAVAMGLFSESGIVGFWGIVTVVGSKVVQETDFGSPEVPRKKNDDK